MYIKSPLAQPRIVNNQKRRNSFSLNLVDTAKDLVSEIAAHKSVTYYHSNTVQFTELKKLTYP